MPAIEPDFLRFSKICSDGVKLKSASITTTSCWSARSRSIVDDERRRHQPLLLQPLMRVHPERAAEVQGEVVVGAAARRDRRAGNPRHAVLPPRRRHPVPMDEAWFADAVLDAHAEGLADFGGEAERPVWLSDAVDRRRLAVHLDIASLKPQDRRRGWPLSVEVWARAGIGGAAKTATPPWRSARRDIMQGASADFTLGRARSDSYQASIRNGTCKPGCLRSNDKRRATDGTVGSQNSEHVS